jgi:hypothetical protein
MSDKKEAKDVKDLTKYFLPKEIRIMYLTQLESRGLSNLEDMNDLELSNALHSAIDEDSKKLLSFTVDKAVKDLNSYVTMNEEMVLTDKEFLKRLFNLNMPYFYLHLFKDADKSLRDDQIWSKIRRCGINPIGSVQEVLMPRYSTSKGYATKSRRF